MKEARQITVGSKALGTGMPTYTVAEIGINHNGDVKLALKLIKEAHDAGFDAVKFQKRTISEVYTEDELNAPRTSPFGSTNGDLKRRLEFGLDEYAEIARSCSELGIAWFASPWDVESILFLERFDIPLYKVASACLTNSGLLRELGQTNKPIIMSTGMSTLDQIAQAVEILASSPLVLMHTTSVYPADDHLLNLSRIETLRTLFGLPVGYSGHEVGILPTVIAVATYGACVVERHVTLDRAMFGSDQAASLEPPGMRRLISYIRQVENLAGDPTIRVLDEELDVQAKLRRVQDF